MDAGVGASLLAMLLFIGNPGKSEEHREQARSYDEG
jgi:hypothetical protein